MSMNTPRYAGNRIPAFWTLLILMVCLMPLSAPAATSTVDLVRTGGGMTNVAQASPLGYSGHAAAPPHPISADLALLPFVSVINPNGIPGGATVTSATAEGIDFKRFSLANAQL